jgi:hypothetical protein
VNYHFQGQPSFLVVQEGVTVMDWLRAAGEERERQTAHAAALKNLRQKLHENKFIAPIRNFIKTTRGHQVVGDPTSADHPRLTCTACMMVCQLFGNGQGK